MTNKVKDLRLLPDGTYEVVLGAFSDPFRNGLQYDAESVREAWVSRCREGREMYVEYGAPRSREPKLFSAEAAIKRIHTIDDSQVCGRLHFPMGMDEDHMTARFMPTGPYGDAVRKILEDPEGVLHFGMRGLTKVTTWPERAVSKIITFDLINPPKKEEEVSVAPTVRVLPEPALEIEVRGSIPGIGKTQVTEIIRRALLQNGFTNLDVVCQDGDITKYDGHENPDLANGRPELKVTLLDNNAKITGVKQ